jgi:hypothetical protein
VLNFLAFAANWFQLRESLMKGRKGGVAAHRVWVCSRQSLLAGGGRLDEQQLLAQQQDIQTVIKDVCAQ